MDKKLYIWFIDVGMGDATFIKFPDGTTALVDFGSTKVSSILGDVLNFFNVLADKNFFSGKNINYLFLTHPDRDHYNLLSKLLFDKQFTFETIFYTGERTSYNSGGQCFLNYLLQKYCEGKALHLNKPDGIKDWRNFGGAKIHLLAANHSDDKLSWSSNRGSIVLMIEYGSQKVILAADATYETEAQILRNLETNLKGLNIEGAILKLGHHGSARTSTSKEWVEAVKPVALFISAERTGTQTGSDGRKTGHRLPQIAAIDTVLQFSPDSLERYKGICFSYVGYYDKKDDTSCFYKSRSCKEAFFNKSTSFSIQNILKYQTFNEHDQTQPDNYYYEIKTNKAIFTTICKLDYKGYICKLNTPCKSDCMFPTNKCQNITVPTDLGTTYGLTITSEGWEVSPWAEYFHSFAHWTKDEESKGFRLGTEDQTKGTDSSKMDVES